MKLITLITTLTLGMSCISSAVTIQDVIAASRNYHEKQAALAKMPEFTVDYETAKRAYTKAFKNYFGNFEELQKKVAAVIGKKPAKKLAEWQRKKEIVSVTLTVTPVTGSEQTISLDITPSTSKITIDDIVAKAIEYQAKFAVIESTSQYKEYWAAKKAYKPTFAEYMKTHPSKTRKEMIEIFTQELGKKEAKKLGKWFQKLSVILAQQA